MNRAYNQIPLSVESREYTAFAIDGGKTYEWLVMPFGITNAPAAFCKILDRVFPPYFDKFSGRYLDDVYVATPTNVRAELRMA